MFYVELRHRIYFGGVCPYWFRASCMKTLVNKIRRKNRWLLVLAKAFIVRIPQASGGEDRLSELQIKGECWSNGNL